MSKLVLGIDLGTTNSVASIWNGHTHTVIKNKNLDYFPSVINFTEHGKIICETNNEKSIRNIKRLIGCDYDNVQILKILSDINYDFQFDDSKILFHNKYENKQYNIEELNSLVLKRIVSVANKQLESNIEDVVITIPSHFNQIQRDSVLISSKLANLNCIRIINEPTAASLSYGLKYHNDVNLLIFDLGGGTLDITYLNVDDGIFEILKTTGDNLLGGEDFTKLIFQDVISNFKMDNKHFKLDENVIKEKFGLLRNKCEDFKCNKIDDIFIENFYDDIENNIQLSLNYKKSRNEIKYLFDDVLKKIENILEIFFTDESISKDEINYIILVGGSTKLIEIKNLLEFYFRGKELMCTINPDLVVSFGAAIQGYLINNPDEEFSKNIALVDILPLSIGIESDNGNMTKIVNKGSKLPVTKTKYFTNDEDNQNEVDINIYQGEREFISDNVLIGNFKLQNLRLRKKNKNIIIVEINVDKNSMINITAFEKGTDNNKKISIKKENYYFDEDKINKMIEESIKFDKIDSYKIKYFKLSRTLENQLNNLKFNCYENKYLNLLQNEYDELSEYIKNIDDKYNVTKNSYDNNLNKTNEDYEYIINNLKRILKANSVKYKLLIENYEIENINKSNYDEVKYENSEYNKLYEKLISKNINSLNESGNISIYSKNIITSILKNKLFKLKSEVIDNDTYHEYIDTLNEEIQNLLSNDKVMIDNYSDLQFISNILNSNNIDFEINNFSNLNKLEKFNLLYNVCLKYNVSI